MSKQERKAILDSLTLELIKSNGETTDKGISLVNSFYNSISQDISEAIGVADEISAPFIIAALERYAKRLREHFSDSSEVVEWINELGVMEVVTNKKEDNKNG